MFGKLMITLTTTLNGKLLDKLYEHAQDTSVCGCGVGCGVVRKVLAQREPNMSIGHYIDFTKRLPQEVTLQTFAPGCH